jgi:hypothetical protein
VLLLRPQEQRQNLYIMHVLLTHRDHQLLLLFSV